MRIMGIDEAGRGCIIGPMVICGIVCDEIKLGGLKEIGVRDSKELSKSRREKIYEKIFKVIAHYNVVEVTPQEIARRNLNRIGTEKIIELIGMFLPDAVYIDAPVSGQGLNAYNVFIKNAIKDRHPGSSIKIICENRADRNYPVVGAASIIAKVHRDRIIEKLKDSYEDFGSGYTSDSKTIEFLKRYYVNNRAFPEKIVRKKWKTLDRIRQADNVSGE